MKKTRLVVIAALCVLTFNLDIAAGNPQKSVTVFINQLSQEEHQQVRNFSSIDDLLDYPELVRDIYTKGLGFRNGEKRTLSREEKYFVSTRFYHLIHNLPFITSINYENMVTSMVPPLYDHPVIERLDLSGNPICEIPKWLFTHLKTIKYLNVTNTQLSDEEKIQLYEVWYPKVKNTDLKWRKDFINFVYASAQEPSTEASTYIDLCRAFMTYFGCSLNDLKTSSHDSTWAFLSDALYKQNLKLFLENYSAWQALRLIEVNSIHYAELKNTMCEILDQYHTKCSSILKIDIPTTYERQPWLEKHTATNAYRLHQEGIAMTLYVLGFIEP